MFTARLRRKRHLLETYIRVEVEERKSLAERAPVPLRPESPEAASGTADENPIATSGQADKLSA